MTDILGLARHWVTENSVALSKDGLAVALNDSPLDRDKTAISVDLDSATRLTRLIIWDSGEATLTVGDIVTGAILMEDQFRLDSQFGLNQAFGIAVAWTLGEQAPGAARPAD